MQTSMRAGMAGVSDRTIRIGSEWNPAPGIEQEARDGQEHDNPNERIRDHQHDADQVGGHEYGPDEEGWE